MLKVLIANSYQEVSNKTKQLNKQPTNKHTMSLLNKQNIKQMALEAAKTYDPEKTRISKEFIEQLEDLVACVTIQQVLGQEYTGMTLKATDWGNDAIQQANRKFTKLNLEYYLRGS